MNDSIFLASHSPALEKVAHRSMKDVIAERFAGLIASGILSVGDSFPSERDLAATMGVSRETIRGALLILSTKGIVSVVQGARTRVASADVGDLVVVFQSGAYGYSASPRDFLGHPHPLEVLL